MVSLYRKIEKIIHEIDQKYNSFKFVTNKDIILQSIYDYEKNINSSYKTLGLNVKSTSAEKFKFLSEKLEEIYKKENIFLSYDLLIGDYDEGYTLQIKFNDKLLILNNAKSLREMRELLKKYEIEKFSWFDIDEQERKKITHLALNTLTEEEKEMKKKNEEKKSIKQNNLIKALKNQEKYIKIKVQKTKKNTKTYKNIFISLKNKILSIEKVKDKILKILPYGSVTQCTNNENSDMEMTIISKNYEKANSDYIYQIFSDIQREIEDDENGEFEMFLEGIRQTKRTILLLIRHKKSKTEIEINCNNFFSVMNSTLIRNYLVYDARVLILINTIKDWSKIKGINSNNKGFLSSYCFTLMTIFFLQRIKNPLLPIICSCNDLVNIKVNEREFLIERNLLHSSELMQKWHTKNKEDTVSTLLLKWMIFYLYLFNEEEYYIDINNKRLSFRFNEAKYLNSFVSGKNKLSAYSFIDMFDYTYNPGSYMEANSSEHILFKDTLKISIEQLLEGKTDFFHHKINN
jgi:DNA polymerase sigma